MPFINHQSPEKWCIAAAAMVLLHQRIIIPRRFILQMMNTVNSFSSIFFFASRSIAGCDSANEKKKNEFCPCFCTADSELDMKTQWNFSGILSTLISPNDHRICTMHAYSGTNETKNNTNEEIYFYEKLIHCMQ